MAIQLRRKDETFDLELGALPGKGDPTVLVGRYIPHGVMVRLEAQCTKRGVLDQVALTWAIWEYALVGWRHLYDADGADVPFTTERRREVIEAVPQGAAELFLMKTREPGIRFHAAEGNSSGSSPGAPTATTPSGN